jgi:hypothetical protein
VIESGRPGEIFKEKRETGDASESSGVLYVAGPSLPPTAAVRPKKRTPSRRPFRPRWLREPEKVRHRWRMGDGDGESRLVELDEVGEDGVRTG